MCDGTFHWRSYTDVYKTAVCTMVDILIFKLFRMCGYDGDCLPANKAIILMNKQLYRACSAH